MAYCNNDPVNMVDPTGTNGVEVLYKFFAAGAGAGVLDGPLPLGDLVGGLLIIIGLCTYDWSDSRPAYEFMPEIPYANDLETPKVTITEDFTESTDDITVNESKKRTKEEADPNRRPGQKKQGREPKAKSRRNPNWKERNNKRRGRDPLPKHSPSKKGHRKYFKLESSIRIFGGKL